MGNYSLIRGPQDGAKVRIPPGRIPRHIHVGPRWLGDGYAAWSVEVCPVRFPIRYDLRAGTETFIYAKDVRV